MSQRIYVGNLPMDVREKDVEDVFYKYGRIRDIDLKTPARPPAFAFVSFEDSRDAEDAVRGRDGYDMDGNRLRVELARGGRGEPGGRMGGRGGAPMGGGRQTEHRVIVTGLPPSASWQDLKDHMRKAGDVVYTDVDHRGGGIVHYGTRDDMEYALRKLDESEFRNPFDRSYIRVLPHRGARKDSRDSRSRSRSPPRRGGGGSSRGGKRYSSSRSRSRSPRRRSRSRSGSKDSQSRSRSPRAGGAAAAGGDRSRSRSVPRKESSDLKEGEKRAESDAPGVVRMEEDEPVVGDAAAASAEEATAGAAAAEAAGAASSDVAADVDV